MRLTPTPRRKDPGPTKAVQVYLPIDIYTFLRTKAAEAGKPLRTYVEEALAYAAKGDAQ